MKCKMQNKNKKQFLIIESSNKAILLWLNLSKDVLKVIYVEYSGGMNVVH